MAWTGPVFRRLLPVIERLPDGQQFDCGLTEGVIEMQCYTQASLRALMDSFPGVFWKKSWEDSQQWWNYDGAFGGVKLHVYAVREGPASCTAIVEKQMVEEKVPVTFETRMVEKEVIVGWDCPQPEGAL